MSRSELSSIGIGVILHPFILTPGIKSGIDAAVSVTKIRVHPCDPWFSPALKYSCCPGLARRIPESEPENTDRTEKQSPQTADDLEPDDLEPDDLEPDDPFR